MVLFSNTVPFRPLEGPDKIHVRQMIVNLIKDDAVIFLDDAMKPRIMYGEVRIMESLTRRPDDSIVISQSVAKLDGSIIE